jgi:hypothetical protein
VKVYRSTGPVARSPGLGSTLMFRHADGRLAVLPMKGNSPLSQSPVFENRIWVISQEHPEWKVIGTGDFNNDSHGDLFWQRDDGVLDLWHMEGTAILRKGVTAAAVPALPGLETGPLFGDLDVNGITDLVWNGRRPRRPGEMPPEPGGIFDSNYVYLEQAWLMQLGSAAPASTEDRASAIWATAGLGQFDAAGALDRLRRSFDGRTSIVLSTGVAITGPRLSRSWLLKGIGDFDGDGTSDVLFQHEETGELRVWKVLAGAIVNIVPLQAVPVADWQIQGLADTDGDGRSDIVWRNPAGDLSVWRTGDAITVADYGAPLAIDPAWVYTGALPTSTRVGGTLVSVSKYVASEGDCVDETFQVKGRAGSLTDLPVAKYAIALDSGQWHCRYFMGVPSYYYNIAGAWQLLTQFNGAFDFTIMPDTLLAVGFCPAGATCKETPPTPPPAPAPDSLLVALPIWGGLQNYNAANGEPVWYLTIFGDPNGPLRRPPGKVLSIRALQNMFMPTHGNSALNCNDPSKTILVRSQETLSGDRLALVYGTAQPRLPITIQGCVPFTGGGMVSDRLFVELTWQPD